MAESVPTVLVVASHGRSGLPQHMPGVPPELVRAVRELQDDSWTVIEVDLIAGVNRIRHGLGRVPVGWQIVDINAPQTMYQVIGDLDDRLLYLTLNVTGTVQVRLFIF